MPEDQEYRHQRRELNAEFNRIPIDGVLFRNAAIAVERAQTEHGRAGVEDYLRRLMRDGYTMGAMRERLGKHQNQEDYE